MPMETLFSHFANWFARAAGRPVTFIGAAAIILAWAISGPIFRFSDTWQLAINTGTTIVTFLMVFVIQNTQNRESAALQLKLDELIRATHGARNALLDVEQSTEADLDEIRVQYESLARDARHVLEDVASDVSCPDDQSTRRENPAAS